MENGLFRKKSMGKFNTTVEQIMTRNPRITNENLICVGDYPYIRQ